MIKVTKADQIFDVVDGYMRPLPFVAQSIISTIFISVVPIFLIYAMNMCVMRDERTRESFTYILLSFAMGGLLGDVFFHTIPHLSGGGHDHGHDHGGHDHHDHEHHHDHDHGHDHHHDHGHAHSEEDMQINLVIIAGIWTFFMIEKITHKYFSDGHDHHGHTHGSGSANKKNDN